MGHPSVNDTASCVTKVLTKLGLRPIEHRFAGAGGNINFSYHNALLSDFVVSGGLISV